MPSAEPSGFRHLGERTRYEGSFIRLVTATFLDPTGYTFERDLVRHLGAVCVVAVDGNGSVLMLHQYRGALDRDVLEIPAGKLDIAGEELEQAARRELLEETGATAERWTNLGAFYNSPGFTDELTTCFLAEGLTQHAPEAHGVEEEHMRLEAMSFATLWRLQARGELADAKSLIALFFAERELDRRATSDATE